MLYAVTRSYYIEANDVTHLRYEKSTDSNYPYTLIILTKDGHSYSIKFVNQAQCETAIRNIVRLKQEEIPVSRFEVETIAVREREKLKRYIKKLLTEAKNNEGS